MIETMDASNLPKKQRKWPVAVLAAGIAVVAVAGVVRTRQGPPSAPVATPPSSNLPRVEGASIVLPASFAKMAGIESQAVSRRSVATEITVPGNVAFDPEHVAAVGTRARGLVRKVYKFEGDVVHPDDVLAEIDSPDLSYAQGSAMALAAQSLAAKANARREQELYREGMTTTRDLEVATASAAEQQAHLQAAKRKVATLAGREDAPMGIYMLHAPMAGVVTQRMLHTGQTVEENVVAFRVANLDSLWVELAVGERHLGGMKRGDPVEIRAIAHPKDVMQGELAYVGDVIDPLSGTAPVRVVMANKDRKLRPGQSVTATIRLPQAEEVGLAVPESAITPIDGKKHVFLELAPLRVQPTPVETGTTHDGWVEIRSGLKESDRVITSGVFALKSELFR